MGSSGTFAFNSVNRFCRLVAGRDDAEVFQIELLELRKVFNGCRDVEFIGIFTCAGKKSMLNVKFSIETDTTGYDWKIAKGRVTFGCDVTNGTEGIIYFTEDGKKFIPCSGLTADLIARYRQGLAA